jgi:glycosyltransferase involved in cell wall biosynthesis
MCREGMPILPIMVRKLPTPLAVLQRWIYAALIIREASIKIEIFPDLVFFNSLDSYFSRYLIHQIIDAVFPYNWSGLSLQAGLELLRQSPPTILPPYFHHFIVVQSYHCKAISVLDQETGKKLQKKLKKPVITFPDITDESAPNPNDIVANQIKEKAHGRTIVGLLGVLQKRKGLLTLLEVAQQCIHEDFFFVFAGALDKSSFSDEELSKVISASQTYLDNCFFHFSMIPDGPRFNALINSCDILFAAYEFFPNSSNILTKAAVFKKPIIVSKGFCLGERVKSFNLGVTIPEGNVSKCLQALHYLSNELKSNQSKFGFESYKLLHSHQKLRESFSQIIQSINPTHN